MFKPKQDEIPKDLRDHNKPGRLEGAGLGNQETAETAAAPGQAAAPAVPAAAAEGDHAIEPEAEPPVPAGESEEEEDAAPDNMEQQFARVLAAIADGNGKTVVTSTQETKPPQFEGVKDARAAEYWLSKLDSISQQNDWTDKKYIEAASNAMIKEAENWIQSERFANAMKQSDSLANRENFRKAFLKMFRTKVSPAEQILAWTTLKQKSDESVRSFWIRVDTTKSEFVKNYLIQKGWNVAEEEANVTNTPEPQNEPPEDETNAQRAAREAEEEEARQLAEEQLRKRQEAGAVMAFANTALRDMFFVTGLRGNISEKLRPRLNELVRMEYSLLDAALEAEAAVNKASGSVMDQQVAAYGWGRGGGQQNRGRGGRGGFNGRGGRGGGNYRGDFQGQQAGNEANGNKLRKIQNRTNAIYCNKCCQWGKHFASECRRPNHQIAAMSVMDRNDKPTEAYDDFYDNLTEMPPKPSKEDEQEG